jgi:hypothetical protein
MAKLPATSVVPTSFLPAGVAISTIAPGRLRARGRCPRPGITMLHSNRDTTRARPAGPWPVDTRIEFASH